MAIDLSVVVTTYNRKDLLMKCLDALLGQSLPGQEYEIIVVDDGSTDGTEDLIRRYENSDPVRLIYHRQKNAGPAAARNAGIERARGSLVAFTDDDCIPADDWLLYLAEDLPHNRLCAGIGGHVVRARDSLIGRYIDRVGAMQPPRRRETGEIGYLVTANAMYRRQALVEINGFNEDIKWPGGEDPELSERLRRQGYHLSATERAVVRHHHRDSLKGLYRTFWLYGRGLAFRRTLAGERQSADGWMTVLRRITRGSAHHLRNREGNVALSERVGFALLSVVHLLGFQRGLTSLRD